LLRPVYGKSSLLNGLNFTLTALHPEVALALAVSLSISGLTLFFLSPTKQLPKEDIYLIELRSNHMGIFNLSQTSVSLRIWIETESQIWKDWISKLVDPLWPVMIMISTRIFAKLNSFLS